MNLLLKRRPSTQKTTIGEVYLEDRLVCYTCEDVIRPAGQKVYGQTAIPPGIYEIKLAQPPKYQKAYGVTVSTPWLQNVPMFEGILIHPGNTAVDTEGCLLPGLTVNPDGEGVGVSGLAYGMLCLLIGHALGAGEQVFIEVENP